MSEAKKRVVISVVIISVVILILLVFFSLLTESFTVKTILHIFLHLLYIPIVLKFLDKCFRKQLTNSINKVLVLCWCILGFALVIVDAGRFILSRGNSIVLFLPICLPICFMIIMFYSVNDTGRDKKRERMLTFIIGIPLFFKHYRSDRRYWQLVLLDRMWSYKRWLYNDRWACWLLRVICYYTHKRWHSSWCH